MATLTVLGIGNVLMRDEGLGVHLLEAVEIARDWPDEIEFIDGGAGGLGLLNFIEQAERLVVFDAADMHLAPGEYRIVQPEQVANDTPAHRISMHDVPFMETLTLCERFTHAPALVRILVVQPESIDFGRGLGDVLMARFDTILDAAIDLVTETSQQAGLTV